jgi:D-alanyl-D-alanine carboxypeptidase
MRTSKAVLIPCLIAFCLLVSCTSPAPGGNAVKPRGSGNGLSAAGPGQPLASGPAPRPKWKRRVDRLVPNRKMSIHARYNGDALYSHGARNRRPPASNEKLLLTMALFDGVGPDFRIETDATVRRIRKGVVQGDLWIKGHGDPSLSKGGGHAAVLRFGATRINRMVRKLKKAGVKRIEDDVMGSRRYFSRDWNAPGWKPFFNDSEVALPTALALNGNVYKGKFTRRPELILARVLKKRLRRAGIRVGGGAGIGAPPDNVKKVATVSSKPLRILTRFMNRTSSNFFAETLGKLLDARVGGPPGRIAGGARRLRRWARHAGVRARTFDSSGLSYKNRMSARGIVNLLEASKERPWISALRRGLPTGGQGTLKDRFPGLRIRAKTGTLDEVSTLSGWVWLRRPKAWAEFSIMSRGLDKSRAVELENKIVRLISRRAH